MPTFAAQTKIDFQRLHNYIRTSTRTIRKEKSRRDVGIFSLLATSSAYTSAPIDGNKLRFGRFKKLLKFLDFPCSADNAIVNHNNKF